MGLKKSARQSSCPNDGRIPSDEGQFQAWNPVKRKTIRCQTRTEISGSRGEAIGAKVRGQQRNRQDVDTARFATSLGFVARMNTKRKRTNVRRRWPIARSRKRGRGVELRERALGITIRRRVAMARNSVRGPLPDENDRGGIGRTFVSEPDNSSRRQKKTRPRRLPPMSFANHPTVRRARGKRRTRPR